MRDREMRSFVTIALAVVLTGWLFGKGIKWGVVLWQASEMPELSFETEVDINLTWVPNVQERLLRSLEREVRAVQREAEREFFRNPLPTEYALTGTDCGNAQYEYDPILKRMMPAGANRLQ